MKVERLELLHLRVPLAHPLETPLGPVRDLETLIVCARAEGLAGFGEVPAGAAPWIGPETVQSAWYVIQNFLAPRLKGRAFSGPGPVSDLFAALRGQTMAKAGVEMAILDLFARLQREPVWKILGGERTEVETGIDLGLVGGKGDLPSRVETAVGKGARRVTIPIDPRNGVDTVSAVRARFPRIPLSVDAGGAYRLSDADALRKLDAFEPLMLEQPLSPDDLVDHGKLQAGLKTPISLEGSVTSYDAARHAFELGACRILNVHPSRVGGPYAAKMIHNLARKRGAPVWCGGFVETGIGRAHGAALASLPGFELPGDFGPGALAEDVIEPELRPSPGGTVPVPAVPGIGYNVDERRLTRFIVRREHVLQ